MNSIQCGDAEGPIGAWDNTNIRCIRSTCPLPPGPNGMMLNGQYICDFEEPGQYQEGTNCQVTCSEGYIHEGADELFGQYNGITCLNGVWNNPGVCRELSCNIQDLRPIAHGMQVNHQALAACQTLKGGQVQIVKKTETKHSKLIKTQ